MTDRVDPIAGVLEPNMGDIDAPEDPSSYEPDTAVPETPQTAPADGDRSGLAGIQFRADEPDLGAVDAGPAPAIIRSRVGDLPAELALCAAAVSLGFGLALLGILLPMDQTEGRRPLLAIESVSAGLAPNPGYWFALAVLIAGFASQLIAFPVLARRGRRLVWIVLLVAIGAAETAGFAVARRSGVAGDVMGALPPILGLAGGITTGVAGLVLGVFSFEREGVKCGDCRAVLARESGYCPDCGAWLSQVAPTRSRLARAWHSGLFRGLSSVAVLALSLGSLALLVVVNSPSK